MIKTGSLYYEGAYLMKRGFQLIIDNNIKHAIMNTEKVLSTSAVILICGFDFCAIAGDARLPYCLLSKVSANANLIQPCRAMDNIGCVFRFRT